MSLGIEVVSLKNDNEMIKPLHEKKSISLPACPIEPSLVYMYYYRKSQTKSTNTPSENVPFYFAGIVSVCDGRRERHNSTIRPVLPSGILGHREGQALAWYPLSCRSSNAE
jgi:hypothetical protein